MALTMTRARVWIIAILAAMALALGAAPAAMADVNDDVISVDDTLKTAVTAFSDVYADQSVPIEDVVTAAETFQTAAETAQTDFQTLADDNPEISEYAGSFADEAGNMAAATGDIIAAFDAQDEAALSEAETDLNDAFEAYDATTDEYNQYLKTAGDPTYMVWLVILIIAVVFLVLALIFALLTRKQQGLLPAKADRKGNIQQSSLKKLRWMVVLWAAVFVVGAAIPFFQIAFASPEQTSYRIFWYPLAIGVVLSIVGVIQYFIAAGKVRREGSAAAYDPNDPATFGAVQGGVSPIAPGAGYQPVPPGYDAQGVPVQPAPPVGAPAAPAAPAPAPAPYAPAPAADVPAPAAAPAADAPAPAADAPAPAAAPEAPQPPAGTN